MSLKKRDIILYVILVLGFVITFVFSTFNNNSTSGQSAFSTQFDANGSKFAFVHRFENSNYGLVLFDIETKEMRTFQKSGAITRAPSFSRDGDFLYFSYEPLGQRISDLDELSPEEKTSVLTKCSTRGGNCEAVLEFVGSISSIVELADGSILFAAGLPEVRADPFSPEVTFLGYRNYDFYHMPAGRKDVVKLSNLKTDLLMMVSISDDNLVFQMPQTIASYKKHGDLDSEIYQARLLSKGSDVELSFESEMPLFSYGNRWDIWPSLAPNGKYIAFYSSSSNAEGSIYRLVVATLPSIDIESLIETVGRSRTNKVSKPVFVDDTTIRYMEVKAKSYLFWRREIDDDQSELLVEMPLKDFEIGI